MSQYEVIYPAIERIVIDESSVNEQFVSRDLIAIKLLEDPIAREFIKTSVENDSPSEIELWRKAANYVDWFNSDISTTNPHTERWNDRFFFRGRVRSKHPFTGKWREVYGLMLHQVDLTQDLTNIQQNSSLSETEKTRLILSRLGQGTFRTELIDYWKQCAVTGCRDLRILKASHIKPWRVSSDSERLDPYNGLLLLANVDAAFDIGLISFCESGSILISSTLSEENAILLGITSQLRVALTERHRPYLVHHREHVFRR